MIKIDQVAYELGLADEGQVTDNVKGEARAILKFFGVVGQDGEQVGHLKAAKVYDEAKVKRIAEVRASF